MIYLFTIILLLLTLLYKLLEAKMFLTIHNYWCGKPPHATSTSYNLLNLNQPLPGCNPNNNAC